MRSDLAILLSSYVLSVVFGRMLARAFPENRYRWLAAPAMGYGFAGVTAMVLYRFGLSIPTIYQGLWLLCILLLADGAYKTYKTRSSFHLRRIITLENMSLIALWVAATALVILPAWTGGHRFTVFQGNQWDHFSYVTSALVFSKEPFHFVAGSKLSDWLESPLLQLGRQNIHGRPTVMVLFATLAQILPNNFYRLAYAFDAFLLSTVFGALSFLLINLFDLRSRRSIIIAGLISFSFVVGFWGQFIFDINAWSQLSSVSFMILLVTQFVLMVRRDGKRELDDSTPFSRAASDVLSVAMFIALLLWFYPEGLAFNLLCISIYFLAVRLIYGVSPILQAVIPMAVASVLGVSSGFLFQSGTLGWLNHQCTNVFPSSWFQYFDGFYGGRSGHAPFEHSLAGISDALSGLFGMYFLTAERGWGCAAAMVDQVALFVLCLAALGAAISIIRANGKQLGPLAWGVVIGLACSAGLAFTDRLYAAGKGLSFESPFLFALLMAPLLVHAGRRARWSVVPALVLLLSQVGLGFYRPYAAMQHPEQIYPSPYPASQQLSIKDGYDWNVDALMPELAKYPSCRIDVDNQWLSHYLMLVLESKNIPYLQSAPIYGYYTESPLGRQSNFKGPPGCRITLVEAMGSPSAYKYNLRVEPLTKNVTLENSSTGSRQ